MAPNTAQEWLTVANERAADAEAMLSSRSNSIGPIYMAGYAIECSLKAYLQSRGIAFPSSGSQGHNLKALWRASKFKLRDLNDNIGNKTGHPLKAGQCSMFALRALILLWYLFFTN